MVATFPLRLCRTALAHLGEHLSIAWLFWGPIFWANIEQFLRSFYGCLLGCVPAIGGEEPFRTHYKMVAIPGITLDFKLNSAFVAGVSGTGVGREAPVVFRAPHRSASVRNDGVHNAVSSLAIKRRSMPDGFSRGYRHVAFAIER